MKKIFIPLTIILLFYGELKAQNPFEKYGYHVEVLTMTNGKFNEFFDLDSIQQIGEVLINTNTMKIVGFAEKDSINPMPDASVISRWVSPDPLKFYFISPYNYTYNNPIRFFDPNGKIGRDANGNIVYIQTGNTTVLTQNEGKNVTSATQVIIFTDKGNPVIAYMNPNDDRFSTNCHGNSLADGQFWINNDQAEIIIKDDYSKVKKKKNVEEGDVATYTDFTSSETKLSLGTDQSGNEITKTKTDYTSELAHTAPVANKGEKRNDITVNNLGGMQKTTTETNYKDAWNNTKSNVSTTIKIFRKNGEDKTYTDKEIQKFQKKYGDN